MRGKELEEVSSEDEIKECLRTCLDAELGVDPDNENRTVIFCHLKKGDRMWGVIYPGTIGILAVSFDKKHILNLWRDYPQNFTQEQRDILWEEWGGDLPKPIKDRGR